MIRCLNQHLVWIPLFVDSDDFKLGHSLVLFWCLSHLLYGSHVRFHFNQWTILMVGRLTILFFRGTEGNLHYLRAECVL